MSTPLDIKLHRLSQILEVKFVDATYHFPAEFLRVLSPSAEVKGHSPDQEVLQYGKQNVAITGIEPQGNYAIKLIFSDDHDSGIYAWRYLQELGQNQEQLWDEYLDKLAKAGKTREPGVSVVKLMDPSASGGCSKKH